MTVRATFGATNVGWVGMPRWVGHGARGRMGPVGTENGNTDWVAPWGPLENPRGP